MKEFNFLILDAYLYMADMSNSDRSGLWTIVEPNFLFGTNNSEMYDCAKRHHSDDCNTFSIKYLGSFKSLRKSISYLNFSRQYGKTNNNLNEIEYNDDPINYEFALP